jgi:hypothetical protein
MAAELLVIGLAIGVGYGLFRLDPALARTAYERIKAARRVVFGLVAALTALVLIASGYLPYMAIGGFVIAYGTLVVLFEEPHEAVLEVVR